MCVCGDGGRLGASTDVHFGFGGDNVTGGVSADERRGVFGSVIL